MKYAVIFEQTGTGYSAYVPDLPGCIAGAATLEETRTLMQEALDLHLEAMREAGEPIPEPTTATEYISAA